MSKKEPTREDREKALAAWEGPEPSAFIRDVANIMRPWSAGERDKGAGKAMNNLRDSLERIAQAIRDSYEEGYQEGRDDQINSWRGA